MQTYAQGNFEGKITYEMSFSNVKGNTVLETLFGNQKIKVLVKQAGVTHNDKEDLILDFKNGIYYKITNHTKSYTVDSFTKGKGDILKSPKSLVPSTKENKFKLGFKTSAYTLATAENPGFENTNSTFWYADSLLYKIPEKYVSFEMVPLFTNGTSVGFGMKMIMLSQQNKKDSFSFVILSVEPKNIPDSMLELPVGYSLKTTVKAFDVNESTAATESFAIDSADLLAPSINPGVTQPRQPAQKSQSGKNKAIKNKHKTPVKKPDN